MRGGNNMTEPSQYFKGRTVQEQMDEVIGYVDTRAAEVATAAIASDVAQVHQDMLDADADAQAAAASAAAAAGTLANAVKKTGEASQSIAGNIEVSGTLKSAGTLYAIGDASVGGNLGVGGTASLTDVVVSGIATVPTPTGNNYAANKKYVDDLDAQDVKLTGAQTVAGVKTYSDSPIVPTEATGTYSTKAANSDKVKNELDAYQTMVRTANNQTVNGIKKMTCNTPVFEITSSTAQNDWYRIAKLSTGKMYRLINANSLPYNSTKYLYQEAMIILPNPSVNPASVVVAKINEIGSTGVDLTDNYIAIAYNSNDNCYYLYAKHVSQTHQSVAIEMMVSASVFTNGNDAILEAYSVVELPTNDSQVVYYL